MSDTRRHALGLQPAINELLHVRARWAEATNEAMQEAKIGARIDHRSLEAQGIDREPRPQIPRAAFEMERHGYRSVVAERLREEYQARLLARVQAGLASVANRETSSMAESNTAMAGAASAAAKPRSTEEIRRDAREKWLRLRQSQLQGHAEPALSVPKERARDDDLSL
jgi:MobA/MobL family